MEKIIHKLFKAIEILIAFFLAVMIILVFMNVLLRYLFNKGFVWSEEIARLCFIYLVFLGAIGAAKDNRHLLIDTLLLKMPITLQKMIYTGVQLCVIWLMFLLAHGSWGLVVQNLNDKWVATHFPTYLVYGIGLVTGSVIIIISVLNIFCLFFLKIPVSKLVAVTNNEHDESIISSIE